MIAYALLNGLVLLAIGVFGFRRRFITRGWWLALVGLVVLTAVFDNVIVGAGIVEYHSSRILGIFVGKAPVEDFAYTIAALVLVTKLWERNDHEK